MKFVGPAGWWILPRANDIIVASSDNDFVQAFSQAYDCHIRLIQNLNGLNSINENLPRSFKYFIFEFQIEFKNINNTNYKMSQKSKEDMTVFLLLCTVRASLSTEGCLKI